MSKTLQQIFAINPTTVVADTDLYYLVQSPYTPGTDAAITGASLKAVFGGGGTVNPGAINQLAYYAAAGTTLSGLATLANGVLVTSAGGVPSISQTLPNAVQDNITRLGTIANIGSPLGGAFGGTGVNNGASTITVGGSLTFSGAFTFTGTLTNTTAVTFPTSGTLATTSQLPTPAALTKTDDTNVTLTLGGTPATALLQAVSLTLGWTGTLSGTRGGTGVNNGANTITLGGNVSTANSFTTSGNFAVTQTYTGITNVTFPTTGTLATTSQLPTLPLSLANGGTNANLTASNGGIFYSTATAGAILAGTATANQVLLSGLSTTPAWSTATYPATTTINQILFSSAANVIGGITTANSGVLVTSAGGVPSISSTLPAFTTSTITFNPTTGGLVGTTTNDNASTGNVGEFVSSVVAIGSPVSLVTATSKTVTSISLTAGDWDVQGELGLTGAGTTQVALTEAGISTTNNTLPTPPSATGAIAVFPSPTGLTSGTTGLPYLALSPCRISVSGTTTVYLVANVTFSVSTMGAYGKITARRMR